MVIKNFAVSLGIEFGPVAIFFLGAFFFDFFVGVALLMAATLASVALSFTRDGRAPLFSLIASVFVLLSGVLTLYFLDPFWVVIEYTLYNLVFACAMFAGYWRNTPALKALFGTMFSLTERGWHLLSVRWGFFFFFTALGGELVWRFFSYDEWVWYRFSMLLLFVMFGFSQFFLARRERLPEASPWGLRK